VILAHVAREELIIKVLDNIKHATGLDQTHSLTDNSSTPSDQYRGVSQVVSEVRQKTDVQMTTTSGPSVPLGHNTEDVTPAEIQATDSQRLV
jgi:hypothetical protein